MNFLNSTQLKALYHQTWPMLIGLFTIMASQLIDSAFIGQLGAKPLAVIGFSLPLYQVVIGVQVGLGIATTACIANALGASNTVYARALALAVLILGICVITLMCLLIWYFQVGIIEQLGAQKSLLPTIRGYWIPWLISCWLGAILYFGYSICRSYGETKIPGQVMMITSVLNVILDPILMFTFDLGLPGAAWATTIAFFIGCLVVFRTVFNRRMLVLKPSYILLYQSIKEVFNFTLPAMLGQFLPPLSALLVTIIIAAYGEVAVGVWGLANRIESMSIILILALTMAMPPLIGKLRGKNEPKQIFKLVKIAIVCVMFIQLLLALMLFAIAGPVIGLLTENTDMQQLLSFYLASVPLSYGALGVCMISVSACNAMGMPTFALIISMVRLFLCYLPAIWIGAHVFGLQGVFCGAMLGNFLSGITAWFIFKRQHRKSCLLSQVSV